MWIRLGRARATRSERQISRMRNLGLLLGKREENEDAPDERTHGGQPEDTQGAMVAVEDAAREGGDDRPDAKAGCRYQRLTGRL